MKIRKTPSKRLAPVPRPLRDLIKSLESEPEDQIPIQVDKLKEWTYPRGDLFHWTAVLNRFDNILLRICNEYKLMEVQAREFDPSTKRLLLAIVNLSRILFENCTNRNIYNSYEHMNSLINTMDIDLLEAVLSFLLRPAQRVNNPRAIRSTFVAPQERITELARGWNTPAGIVDLCKDDLPVTDEMKTLTLRFYRTQDEFSEGTSKSTEAQNSDKTEGVNIITTQLPSPKDKSDIQVFLDLVKEHSIPKEYHFELANRIRVCRHIDDPTLRKKLLIIRILAITIMANTVSETTAQNKVFIYEPHLVANLAELVHPDKTVLEDICVYSLCALDGIARHRSKLTEVLTTLNASANHGALLQILRRIGQEQGNAYSRSFLDAVFTLLACLLQNQPGGQMLMSAGIIPALVQILGNPSCILPKYVSKVVSLLDALVNAFSTSFSAFCNAGGLDTLLNRIKTEVEYCLQNTDMSMKAAEDDASQPDEQNAQTPLAPHDHISALKAMIKFLLRMMESSGTADGLRNLIESSIPQSLLQIISNPKVFGSSVLPLAINVMTTFIHSEPTSLPILQEAKLPQGFLEMICAYETPSSEVLMASVNAFGAICLNQPGLDMFNEANPLPHFFDLMTEHDFLLNTAEVDSATALGSTMDELTRHHPSLRPKVFECVSSMIKKVKQMGTEDIAKPSDNTHRLQLMPTTEGGSRDVAMKSESIDSKELESDVSDGSDKKGDKSECLLVSFIDMVSRFLEGLFQNQTNIREFVKEGCPEILLDYYTLPLLPADFSVTIAYDSLAYIFKMISEVSTLPTIMAIAEKAQNSMKFILEDDRVRKESMVAHFVDVKDNETSKIEEGNTLFRQLIVMHDYVGLLSNICTSAALAPGKSATSLITEFMSGVGDENIVLMLGRLHRTMMWENFLLKESVPASWYSVKTSKKPNQTSTDHPLGIFGVSTEEGQRGTAEQVSETAQAEKKDESPKETQEEKVPDVNDPRMQNLKHFKLLLGDIPQFLMPIFQGLVRASMSRRMMDNAQKAQAFRVTECITELLKDNLTWHSITADDAPPCKYDYLATMYSMISLLMMDDRPQTSLHTPLTLTFDKRGGTDLCLKDLDTRWKEASKLHTVPKDQRSKEQSDLLQRIYNSLEMLLMVFAHIGSPKLLHDSPFTAPIVVKDPKAKDHFDPYPWIISLQLKLSSVRAYLHSPDLKDFPKGIIHVLLEIILEIMKAEEEENLRSEPFNVFSAALSSPFTLVRTPVIATPDERGVQTLVDMGFERSAAEHAMVRCNNQISRAVDWLFSHPTQMLTGGGTSGQGSSRARSQNDTDDNHEDTSDEEADRDDADEPSDNTSARNTSTTNRMDEDGDDDPESDSEDEERRRPFRFEPAGPSRNSDGDNVASEETDENSPEKGKQKAELNERVQELQNIRNSIKEENPPLLLDLIDQREDVIFDVRDVLVTLCKDDKENKVKKSILFKLIDRVEATRAQVVESSENQSLSITKYMRLLALLFRQPGLQSVIPDTAPRLSFIFDMIDNASRASIDSKLPPWITTAFLVLESFISQADEPKKTELIKPKTEEENTSKSPSFTKKDSGKSGKNESKNSMEQEGSVAVSVDQRSGLLVNCIAFLKKPDLSRDEIYAILRIIVRLTKYHGAALEFVDHGGLPLLFTKPKTTLEGLQGQQAFIILILRHIIEDKATLESNMEDMITTWFTIPRPRNMDINAFIRNNAHIVLRDPTTFLEVATRICRLTHYDEYDLPRQVKLLSKDAASDGDTTMADASAAETSEPSGTKQSESNIEENRSKSTSSSPIINHLLQELLSAQSEIADIRRSKGPNEKEKTESDATKREENIKYAYIGFILQCLVELVASYKSCKYDVYSFGRRRNSKDGSNVRQKHSVINMLINDLLPCNAINPIAEESKKQQGLSMWTASLLVAMCHDSGPDKESNSSSKEDLTQVRKYVFDGIIRSLKETSASSGPLSVKYAKYLALSDLCYRILNARPNANGPAQRVKEDSATDIAKVMLDKNFVGLLTSAISDVDINYPHAKTILNTMLRPLEQLTKLAVKISEDIKEDDRKREEEQQHYVPTNEHGEGEEEPPDLYRNSALGMFDASVMEEDEMDEFDTDEEGEETYDEEEFDEDTGSDLSDMSEGETGDEDVDEDMGAMLHQHYDTEMEEDEDDTDEEEDEDVDNSEDESVVGETDEDDVEEEEDGREMTWRLEEIEDDPVIQVSAEVDLESGDEGHGRQHQRLLDAFGDEQDEEELETVDQSDFEEDEESENMDGGEADADLNDGVLLEDDIDSPFLAHDLESDGLLMEEEGRSRTFPGFHMRRLNRFNRTRFSELGIGRSLRSIRGGAGADSQDDVITHPLLSENQASTGTAGQPSRTLPELSSNIRSRSPANNSWQAFEDIIGGSAVRLLESLLTQAPQGAQTGPLRVDVQGRGGNIMRTFEFDHLPFGSRSTARTGEPQSQDQNRELMAVLHDFQPMTSVDRWHQEARMMYGGSLTDKAQNVTNALLNALIPIAIVDEKRQREEDERRRQEQRRIEEEERKKAEEERLRREEEEASRASQSARQAETQEATTTAEANEGASTEAQTQGSEEGPVMITINGEEVDISGTGIDVEFLQALPDDLREEVVSQHMRERRASTQATETDSISPEFLDALPPDIREEVLQQENLERERRDRQRQGAAGAAGILSANNLGSDTLPPLHEFVSELFTSGTPSNEDRYDSSFRRFLSSRAGPRGEGDGASSVAQGQRRPGAHRNAIQLVDRQQLATLARLLFVPQSISKAVLNRLLINLCENNKTRSDLLSFLVCVLHDGSGDLASVDRSFAQLSLQSKGIYKPVSKSRTSSAATMGETVPNLITQRCLEFLMHVVQWNEQSLTYFLTENDCLAGLKRTSSRKGKSKEKLTPSSKYPLLVLISLLDRPVFVENPGLMEELMHLIMTICRPFPLLVKKYVEKVENQQQQQQQNAEEQTKSEGQANTDSEEKHPQKGKDDETGDASKRSKETEKTMPKPPTIPDHYLKLVVHVLTSGECSSKTFQYTLSALSHLSALDGAQQAITNELVADAKEFGEQILRDLSDLHEALENAMPGTEIDASALSHFSAATSHQAKLLRVLKTIDYMYSRKATVTAAVNPDKNADDEAAKNESRLLEIYDELNFLPLWKTLGQCLAVIHEKEELINVATVLLPLIESFMVVSKYTAEKVQIARNSGGSQGSPAPNPTQQAGTESPDDFFFTFTEEHKKILNIMVRNNPSLMSGSFSLLVRNPKMLEFDNKRNYFVQQLHKRTSPREHYPPLQLNVRRQYVFEDSYHQLLGRTGDEIKYGKLSVRFYDEEGVDAGGVAREWFSVLARQMFDPNYALFITSAADKLTYQPNRASAVNPDHLSYLKFVGRVIGKAIYDGRLLDAYFTRSFYKHILGRQVDYRDVEAIDPEYYKSLVWMLENDITDIIDLTFSIETDDFGTTKVIDLKPNGRNIPVTEENKHEYVALVTEQKLTLAIKDQINAFLQGFHDIIPAHLIQIFNEQELELLISGLPDIDIDDWKNNTEYQGGYSASSPQIQWFWRAVRSFDQEERAKLLQFATGTSKVPLEGFAHLQGSGGVQRFQIHKDFGGENRLPSAHTCFNQVDLPEYDSYESLRSNLFKAINECSTGFGFV